MAADLLIMAAGMGSRFGGLKQAAPVGPNGEMLLDFSVYDAKKAGFERTVIIIRKDIEKDFRAVAGKRIEKMIDVEYVFQEKDDLPKGYTLPETREKPWGTGQAVLCARDAVRNPFLVINADDYYGQGIYKLMYDHLSSKEGMCLAGYELGKTLSKNGTVSRGVCDVKDGYLENITEVLKIPYDTDLPLDTVVSMNMWGLDLGIFDFLQTEFEKFLASNINEPKKEFLLPTIINDRIHACGERVRVINTSDKWYGVTYSEDLEPVREAIKSLCGKGLYDM